YLRVGLNGVNSIDVMLQSEHADKELSIYAAQANGSLEKLTTLKAEACQKVRVSIDVGEAYQVYAVLGDGRHAGGVSTTRVWIAPPGSEPTQPLSAPYSLRSCPEEEEAEVDETKTSKGCQAAGVASPWVLLLLWLFLRFLPRKRIV
ncbi:MAG: hypothetical protein QGI45_14830, partial [Myxococcota bacterium]|nr:hypothetical protein [Myxococcota bacterium]